ncbi:MAG: PaaI family thioesterase [Actinomycetota bacterium]
MAYPPDHHLLRDLRVVSYWTGELESRFIAPLNEHVARADGAMDAGALFAVADLAAASTSIAGAGEDWAGTLDLSVRMADAVTTGPLVIEGSVVRAGGTLITVRSELYDGMGTQEPKRFVGMTIGGFRRMKRNTDFNSGPVQRREIGVRREWARAASGFTQSVRETAGLHEVAPGVIELEKSPYVTNSFGTVNGGTTGIVICAGAESALGGRFVAVDVDVRYIGQAKTGPVRTRCEVIRVGDEHAVVDVVVEDTSQDDRAIAAGSVTLLAAG